MLSQQAINEARAAYLHHRPDFERAITDEFWTIEEIDRAVDEAINNGGEGINQFFYSPRAALLTEVVPYDAGPLMQTRWATSHDLKILLTDFAPAVEAWAKEHGCVGALVEGRKGWERAMKRLGYEHFSTTLIKRF